VLPCLADDRGRERAADESSHRRTEPCRHFERLGADRPGSTEDDDGPQSSSSQVKSAHAAGITKISASMRSKSPP
jgi:hypothetical protein